MQKRPNILLITIDACRYDAIRAFNAVAPPTPYISKLAENGLVFTKAYASFGGTPASVPSILYGVWCCDHKCFPVGPDYRHPVACATPSIAEILQEAGYNTIATTTISLLDEQLGFASGFDKFQTRPGASAFQANVIFSKLINKSRPWFGWIHYCDMHAPYQSISRFAKYTGDPYLQNLMLIDKAIEELTKTLNPDWVILTADHGESFGEHGVCFHGNLYEENVRVPLIIWGGGRGVINTIVRLLDIPATVLRMANIEKLSQPAWASRSLFDACRDRQVFFGDRAPDGLIYAGYMSNNFKFIFDTYGPYKAERFLGAVPPSYQIKQLYDLEMDPCEHYNLIGLMNPHVLGTNRSMQTSRALPDLDYDYIKQTATNMENALLQHLNQSSPHSVLGDDAENEILIRLRNLGYI